MILLMSTEKKYFELMLEGKKKYEFRRKFVNTPCSAFIYIPSPISEIQGFIEFGKPIIDSPEKINQIALSQDIDTGEDSDILDYMEGINRGYAIPINNIEKLKKPVTLAFLRKHYSFTAPQGYMILDKRPRLLKYLLSSLAVF